MWTAMSPTLSQRKKAKMESCVASSRMNQALRKVPRASEAKRAKTQRALARAIWARGNQRVANWLAALSMKQKPSEQRKVPR